MTGYCRTHSVFARTNSSWAASLIFNTTIAHFGYVLRPSATKAAHDPLSPGLHHLCLRVDTPADVAAVAAHLRWAGIAATDAKLYPIYAPDYWATYFTDPDGIRLEVTNYRAFLKIQSSGETTSHPTRPPKNGDQVVGYKQDKARAENRDAAYS